MNPRPHYLQHITSDEPEDANQFFSEHLRLRDLISSSFGSRSRTRRSSLRAPCTAFAAALATRLRVHPPTDWKCISLNFLEHPRPSCFTSCHPISTLHRRIMGHQRRVIKSPPTAVAKTKVNSTIWRRHFLCDGEDFHLWKSGPCAWCLDIGSTAKIDATKV